MKRIGTRVALAATAALGLGVGLTPSAHAQEAAADASQDIVVTARRVEERLQDVPISITVLNQEQISNANIVTSSDLVRVTPSLSTNLNYGPDNATFALRGFNQDIGTAPAVGVYFADVVAPRGAANGLTTGDGAGPGAFFDLQNIQVLKGPQGTLFGRNTTGGAILLVPQRPTDGIGGYAEASAGNYGMERYQAVLNLPVGDTFRMRFGIDRQRRDGYQRNTSGIGPDRVGTVDYTALRASFIADLAPNLENYTVVSYTQSEATPQFQKLIRADPSIGLGFFTAGQVASQGDGFYDSSAAVRNIFSDIQTWQAVNTTTWDISENLRFKNIVSYGEFTQDISTPIFGIAVDTSIFVPGVIPFASVGDDPDRHMSDQNTFTEEARFEGSSFDNRLTWQSGVYFERSNPLNQQGALSPINLDCPDTSTPTGPLCYDPLSLATGSPAGSLTVTRGETRFQNTGVYAQATYQLNEEWRFTGGIRYTWDRATNDNVQFAYEGFAAAPGFPQGPLTINCNISGLPPPSGVAEDCRGHISVQSEAPTWLLDVDYTPTPDLLFYAKYARGYRSATIAANVPPPLNTADQEQLDTYEAGAKWTFRGSMPGYWNNAVFFNDFQNQQIQLGFVPRPEFPGLTQTAAPFNVDESRIYGLETEFAISPLPGLYLNVGYTYLHTEIVQMPVFAEVPGGQYTIASTIQRNGDRLPFTPEHKVVLSADYTLPLDESLGEISFGGTYVYTSNQQANYADRNLPGFEDLGVLDAYSLLNLNLTWASIGGSPVDLTLFGTNVTNEEYYATVVGLASSQTGSETAALGEPRMYGVRLRYSFGS